MSAKVISAEPKKTKTLRFVVLGVLLAAGLIISLPFLALGSGLIDQEEEKVPATSADESNELGEGSTANVSTLEDDAVDSAPENPASDAMPDAEGESDDPGSGPDPDPVSGGTPQDESRTEDTTVPDADPEEPEKRVVRTGYPNRPTQTEVSIRRNNIEGFENSKNLQFGVEVDTDAAFSNPQRFYGSSSNEPKFNVDVYGLQKDTRYYYRCFVSADEEVHYGETLQVVTLADPC